MKRSELRSMLKKASDRIQADKYRRNLSVLLREKSAAFGIDTMTGAVNGGIGGALHTIVPAGVGAGVGALIPLSKNLDSRTRRRRRARNALLGGIAGIGVRDIATMLEHGDPKIRLAGLASMGVGAGVGAAMGSNKRGRLENALRGAILGDLAYNTGMSAWANATASAKDKP